jgi:uncharacterized protein YwgA
MDQSQIFLKLVLDTIELPLNMEEFDNRLVIQKTIYLLQASGLDLGYYFGWYIRGPYCSDLTNDAFCLALEIKSDDKGLQHWKASEDVKKCLKKFKSFFVSIKQDGKNFARQLELLASVHFLIQRKQIPRKSPTVIKSTLKKFDKNFSEDEISEALQLLRKQALLTF